MRGSVGCDGKDCIPNSLIYLRPHDFEQSTLKRRAEIGQGDEDLGSVRKVIMPGQKQKERTGNNGSVNRCTRDRDHAL